MRLIQVLEQSNQGCGHALVLFLPSLNDRKRAARDQGIGMGHSPEKPARRHFLQRAGRLAAMLFLMACVACNAQAMGAAGYGYRTTATALIMAVRAKNL